MAGYKRKWTNRGSTNTSYKRRKVATTRRRQPYARRNLFAGQSRTFTAPTGRSFKRKFICTNAVLRGSTASATTGKLGANSVSLSLAPGHVNYTTIFDQYRITHVKWTFTNVGSNSNPNTPVTPYIYYAADFDDQNRPPNKAGILNMDNVKKDSLLPGKMVNINVKPRLATSLYNNGLTTGYGMGQAGTWVDCASAAIPHYGLKYCIDNMLNENYTINLETVIWVEFRGNHV